MSVDHVSRIRSALVNTMAPLREVVETISCDDVMRVERLSCGHTKVTWTASERPAYRRRCWKCAAGEAVVEE